MKQNALIAFLMVFNFIIKAQTNLVPNPSFEDTVSCPYFSDISYTTSWENYGFSPDYYNSCSSSNSFGVPYNWVGQQNAYDGNGYAGIATYASGSQREVIGVQLIQNLTIGVKYFVSGYISRADSADNSPYTCSANKFGFKFSTTPFLWASGNYAPINNFAHVYSNSIITDRMSWTKVAGSFIADSAYQYLMVGNFFDNTNTDTLGCNYSLSAAYYYIDDICVSTDSLICNISTSINESINKIKLNIYPNPIENVLNIEFSTIEKPYNVYIYNSFGENVLNKEVNTSIASLDVSFASSGFLFLKIFYNNQFYHYKLLKL
jgi:hypothetical protein